MSVGNETYGEKEIRAWMKYHAPNEDMKDRFSEIEKATVELASVIDIHCPESGEKALAMERLREARMWANASIALHPTALK